MSPLDGRRGRGTLIFRGNVSNTKRNCSPSAGNTDPRGRAYTTKKVVRAGRARAFTIKRADRNWKCNIHGIRNGRAGEGTTAPWRDASRISSAPRPPATTRTAGHDACPDRKKSARGRIQDGSAAAAATPYSALRTTTPPIPSPHEGGCQKLCTQKSNAKFTPPSVRCISCGAFSTTLADVYDVSGSPMYFHRYCCSVW